VPVPYTSGMATFVIIPTGNPQSFEAVIPERFGVNCYKLPRGEWLVVFDGTSKQLSESLEIAQGREGVVLSFSGYFGYASKDIWEWIAAKQA